MWINLEEIAGDKVLGVLNNQPDYIRSLSRGQRVTLDQTDVIDFMYKDGGKNVGGFTDQVILDAMRRR